MNMKNDVNKGGAPDMAAIAADLADDPTMADAYRAHVGATRIISDLVAARVRAGLSQRDLAKKLGVAPSTISRFEDRPDADLELGLLVHYAEAVGLATTLILDDGRQTDAAYIKSCVCTIQRLLKRLTDITRKYPDDADLCDGIAKFQAEVLLNFLVKYRESADIPRVFDFMPHLQNNSEDMPKMRREPVKA
jgi:transcriptional regulator with XRE-family HTH domain